MSGFSLHILLSLRVLRMSTWPSLWGRVRCPGGLRKPPCAARSSHPGLPSAHQRRTSPTTWRARGFRQWRTGAAQSDPRAQTSSRWTRSWSCRAAESAAPPCCLCARLPGRRADAPSSSRPPGSCSQQVNLTGNRPEMDRNQLPSLRALASSSSSSSFFFVWTYNPQCPCNLVGRKTPKLIFNTICVQKTDANGSEICPSHTIHQTSFIRLSSKRRLLQQPIAESSSPTRSVPNRFIYRSMMYYTTEHSGFTSHLAKKKKSGRILPSNCCDYPQCWEDLPRGQPAPAPAPVCAVWSSSAWADLPLTPSVQLISITMDTPIVGLLEAGLGLISQAARGPREAIGSHPEPHTCVLKEYATGHKERECILSTLHTTILSSSKC